MTPAELSGESFARYPSAGRAFAVQHLALLRKLPAAVCPSFLREMQRLGPVNVRLKELDQMPNIAARYAEIAIRAAVSAAQEERDEMELLLTHASDLSKQMGMAGTPAEWPLPIDELSGELWLEVDRFEEARAAYQRALDKRPSPNAWIGLARSAAKLGDTVTACRAYTAAKSTPNLPNDVELEISLYALKCQI